MLGQKHNVNCFIHLCTDYVRWSQFIRVSYAVTILFLLRWLDLPCIAPGCNEVNIIEKLLGSILFSTSEEEKWLKVN